MNEWLNEWILQKQVDKQHSFDRTCFHTSVQQLLWAWKEEINQVFVNFSLVWISYFKSLGSEEYCLIRSVLSLPMCCFSELCLFFFFTLCWRSGLSGEVLCFTTSRKGGMGNSAGLRRQKSAEKAGGVLKPSGEFRWVVESLFLWWLLDDTCYLLIVGGLGVRAAALLQLLPPLSECSIQVTEITWKPLQRHTDQESAFLVNQSAAAVSLSPTYQIEVRWPLTPEAVVSWGGKRAAAWTLLLEHIPTNKHSLSSKPMWQKHKTFDWQEREYVQARL